MKKLQKIIQQPWAAYTVATCSAVLLYLFLTHLTGPVASGLKSLMKMLSPIVIGLVLAYLIDPLVKWLEHHPLRRMKKVAGRRGLATIIAALAVLLILAGLMALLVPALIESITTLAASSESFMPTIQMLLDKIEFGTGSGEFADSLTGMLDAMIGKLQENLGTIVSTIGGLGSSVMNLVLGLILAIYFLLDKKSLLEGVDQLRRTAMLPEKYEARKAFWKRCHKVFLQYILCSLLDAVIVGAANAVFMLAMRMPYVPLISVVVGVTNILPTFGPLIGMVIGAFLLLLVKPSLALWFLVFSLVLQFLDGNVLKPKLFKDSLGLPAVWSLIAIIVSGKLFGMVGILLAIPVMVVLRFVYTENFLPWLQKRKEAKIKAKSQVLSE